MKTAAVDQIQFAQVVACQLELALHLEAGSASASLELVKSGRAGEFTVLLPKAFKAIKFGRMLGRGKFWTGRSRRSRWSGWSG
jgi:hypothetical protein